MKYYFSFSELTKTDTNLNNCPYTLEQVSNILCLGRFLSHLREKFGAPIYVSSGYRTPEVNEKVGGSLNSKHMIGSAADIWPLDCNNEKLVTRLIDMCKALRSLNIITQLVVNKDKQYIHIAI